MERDSTSLSPVGLVANYPVGKLFIAAAGCLCEGKTLGRAVRDPGRPEEPFAGSRDLESSDLPKPVVTCGCAL